MACCKIKFREKENESNRKQGLCHRLHGKSGVFYPDLRLPEQTNHYIGKYDQMRLGFLKQHRKGVYTTLVTEGRLNKYLYEFDSEVRSQVKIVAEQLAKERNINESLKAADQLRWVQDIDSQTGM